ncbi:MAG TPA: hypothetical protein VN238_18185 [Solirubrobacteraceae bacterium]|nr:hypothetical protein [Solirubrobacteraceae bacterium]
MKKEDAKPAADGDLLEQWRRGEIDGVVAITVEDLEEGKKLIGDRTFAEAALEYWRDKQVGRIGYDDDL